MVSVLFSSGLAVTIINVLSITLAVMSGLILMVFTGRRWLFLVTVVLKKRYHLNLDNDRSNDKKPSVLLLVPFHNEESNLPSLLNHLDKLTYPQGCLKVVYIDDGSNDNSDHILSTWLSERENWHKLQLQQNVGKANALNCAIKHFRDEDLIAVYDADERPQPDALARLAESFKDNQIGAVTGRRVLSNPLDSPIASYAAFENLVHQLITNQAKEILGLMPAILGSNCMYRRIALEKCKGFTPGALLEDSDISLKLARAGWHTRFLLDAISFHETPVTIDGYWNQHTRWASGFKSVVQTQTAVTFRTSQLPLHIRVELFLFALGYLDRVALLMAIAILGIQGILNIPIDKILLVVVVLNLITPLVQVIAALWQCKAPFSLWKRIVFLPFFLSLDMAMALTGLLQKSNLSGKSRS